MTIFKPLFTALFLGLMVLSVLACSGEYNQVAVQDKKTVGPSSGKKSRITGNKQVHSQELSAESLSYYGTLKIKNKTKYYEYLRVTDQCEQERRYTSYVCEQKNHPIYLEIHNIRKYQTELYKAEIFLMPLLDDDVWSAENNSMGKTLNKVFYVNGSQLKSRLNSSASPDRLALHYENGVAIRADLIYEGEVIASGPIHR